MKNLMRLATISLCVIFVACILSCSDEENTTKDIERVPVVLSAGIKTRAVDASWAEGDCIGLSLFKAGTTTFADNQHNHRYTTSGDGTFQAEGKSTLYYPLDGGEVDVRGYYPYIGNLAEDCACKVNVNDQSDLAAINLMTFDCYTGASRNKSNVSVTFKHRLTKLIFNFYKDEQALKVKSFDISGMKTKASFCLLKEQLTIESNSVSNISVPINKSKAEAIVLPRGAQEGIEFTITTDEDEVFTVRLDEEQELKAGYKYTFNIVLKEGETPAVIRGIIQDWTDGGSVNLENSPVTIMNDPEGSVGFKKSDVITLFWEDLEVMKFTYDGAQWEPDSPVYWENLGDGISNKINLRAEFIRDAALNDSQLPEIFLAETTCERFGNITLNFALAPSKVVFKLKSEGNAEETFTQEELDGASILLPNYTTGYKLENGVFTTTDSKGDIAVANHTALIIPQKKENQLAVITLNGNKYNITKEDGLEFLAGKVYTITVNMLKSGVNPSFSVEYTDWVDGGGYETGATPVAISPGTGKNGIFEDGHQITLFHEQTQLATYTYNKANDEWVANAPLYWEEIGDGTSEEVSLRAEFIRNSSLHDSQLPELFLAETVCKRFGNIALNFTLAPSKIIFKLQSDGESEDTFTLSELGKASIMLPEYITGYKLENGVFTVNNDTKGNITVAGRTALIIPQTKGNDLAVITLNGNKYRVSKEDGLEFLAGKIYTITVNMLKSGVTPTFSVTYIDWVDGGEYEIGATPVSLSAEVGKSDVFEDGDKISLFHGQTKLTTYTYNKGGNDWTPDAPLYWEEIGDGSSENVNLRAEFIRNSSLHDSQLPELFLAETVCKRFGSVALNFTLAPSKIVFKLKSEGKPEEVFTQAELNKASILLPDYITGYKLENGIFTVTGGKSDVTVVNRTALIIPQTKKNDLAVITFNGNKYRVSEENGLEFLAGKVYTITVNILKSGATPTFSVTFTDWVPGGEIEIGATPVTIAPTPGKNGAFEDGDQVTLFHEQTKLAIYTYNKGADSWTPDAPLYWEEVGDGSSEEVNLRAEYIRDPALNESQLPEIFTGATTCKRFGSVALNLALEPSKIVFKLKSEGKAEEVFSQAELNKATILLPDYMTGYTLENGVFTVTGSKSSVAVEDRTALIIPQTKKNDLAVITLNGNKYHVSAEDVQEFLAGKVYTITVNILKSGVAPTFSITFTDWVPGGEIEIGATPVLIAPNPGKNGAFEDGDQVTLFHEQTKLAVYTYNKGTDSWTPDAPLYWEEIGDGKSENVTLKAEFIRNPALNDSQLPEIFTGETTCKRFGSVALNLALEPSKIVFKLKSEGKAEEVFSQAELSKASIMLPGYITGYTLENGVFTITASKGDVTVAGRTAVVVPQTKKNDLAVITLGGNKYFVSKEEGQEFQAGKVYTIIVNILKSGVAPTFSVSFTDWVAGGEIEIGSTPVVISPNPGKNGAFEEGDRVTLFHEQTKLVTYTYNKATDDWTPNAPLYWEEIGDGKSENVTLKAEFIRNPALNNTQLPEIFTGETTCKRFGSVALNLALEPSKIVFRLKSEGKPEEVFSQAELSNASIMLPDYITGYTLENGVFTVTTTKGDVTVANRTAVIVPQTKKNDLAVITLNGNRYRVSKEDGQEFQAGKVYTIIVNLLKSGVAPTFSVSFTDWVPGGEIEIGATPVQISPTPGQNGDFRDGDEIVLYHEQTELVTYTYNKSKDEWTPNAPLYWEEIGDGNSAKVKLTGMYKRTDALNATQLPEVMLMETEVDRFQASLHLHFNLVPAKIVFELQSDGTFTEDELKNNTRIQLRNYIIGHTLQYGKFTVNATSKGNVDVEGFTALIVPQEKKGELALISLNGNAYEILDATGMNFEAGKAYKIKVKMSKTNVAFISMSYTDWQDGGEIVVGATPVNLVIPNTQTTDFKDKDKVTLYYGDEKLTTYTYDEPTGKWNPEQPIFWENIGDGVSEDVALRAEFIRASAPDNTQLPEIFLAETTSKRFQGIHLDFNLAPAKIRFVLKSESTDDAQKYAIDQLNGATITLPGYITGYTLANAVFTKGTQTGNINVVNKAAVIVPQEKDGVLALITIAGNTYQVKVNDPVNFQAGKVTTIEVNMLKAGMAGISASYTEWVPGDTEEFTTFIPTTAGTTTNFVPGDELSMYYDDKNGGKTKIGDFTYQGDHKWETNPAVYWENLDGLNSYKFYGVSTLSQAPAASNQMDDVMYAEHANVPRFGNIDLRFTKRTSRIVVGLKCSDGTFSKEELESAVITLPGYTTGGAYNGINYVAGTNKGTITVSPTTTELAWVALIEPQTINAGEILINIRINGNDYLVKKTVNTEFEIARTYTYTVNLLKAGIDFSTSYADWAPGLEETIDVSLD